MKDDDICNAYLSGLSMRRIADINNTNHKLISRILDRNQIKKRVPKNNRGLRLYSDVELKYNNMASHIRFDVSKEWLMQFDDFDKLKLLNDAITNRDNRYNENTEWYKSYINTFYHCKQFLKIYDNWINKKDKYLKPSIDHIIPRSMGGTNEIENLQFLTWFENRCKNNMTPTEWLYVKNNLGEYLC